MRLKPGVKFDGVKWQTLRAMSEAERIMGAYGESTVTSLLDGKHSPNSLHYQGLAVDLRTRHLTQKQIIDVANDLKKALGNDYDVVIEKTHLHVEYDRKGD